MVVSLISICSVMDHQWCQNDVKVRAFRWVGVTNVSTTFWCHLWSTAFLHRLRATWNLSVIHQKEISEHCQWHHLCVCPPISHELEPIKVWGYLWCVQWGSSYSVVWQKKHLCLYLSLLWVDPWTSHKPSNKVCYRILNVSRVKQGKKLWMPDRIQTHGYMTSQILFGLSHKMRKHVAG